MGQPACHEGLLLHWRRLILIVLLGLCQSLAAQEAAAPVTPIRLGLLPYLNTRTLITNYQPLATSLARSLQVPVLLETAPDFDTYVSRVFRGDYDLVLIAPHYARLAEVDFGYQTLLVHKQPIRALLVVRADTPLARIDDIKGQTIAIHERSAIMPILGVPWLKDHGLEESKDYQFVQTVTHSSALLYVQSRRARAAMVSYSTLIQAPAELQQDMAVAAEFAQVPGLYLMAHKRMPAARAQAVKAALLQFEASPEGQNFFKITAHGGYRAATPDDARLLDRSLPETRRLIQNP